MQSLAFAGLIEAADRLVAQQALDGSWPGEETFTGSIVPGLVRAYDVLSNPAYKTAAENGGSYILASAGGNFYGDEAYALARLSDIAPDPSNNAWRTAVSDFYLAVESYSNGGGGTTGYISFFETIDPSTAAFYLAHHVVAAYYVDATDKAIWRNALIDFLGDVDDLYAAYPVLGLGVSLWALAETGPLDTTLVDPDAEPGSTWEGKQLEDLPDMLLGHQESSGPYAGAFYWRFDHTEPINGGPAVGYTEETVFGTLGLMATAQLGGFPDYSVAIDLGRRAVYRGADGEGQVYEHLWDGTLEGCVFAGDATRLLIPEPGTLGIVGVGSFLCWVRRRRRRTSG